MQALEPLEQEIQEAAIAQEGIQQPEPFSRYQTTNKELLHSSISRNMIRWIENRFSVNRSPEPI